MLWWSLSLSLSPPPHPPPRHPPQTSITSRQIAVASFRQPPPVETEVRGDQAADRPGTNMTQTRADTLPSNAPQHIALMKTYSSKVGGGREGRRGDMEERREAGAHKNSPSLFCPGALMICSWLLDFPLPTAGVIFRTKLLSIHTIHFHLSMSETQCHFNQISCHPSQPPHTYSTPPGPNSP